MSYGVICEGCRHYETEHDAATGRCRHEWQGKKCDCEALVLGPNADAERELARALDGEC